MAPRRMERALSEANGCLSFGRIYCWNFHSRGLFASGGKSALGICRIGTPYPTRVGAVRRTMRKICTGALQRRE